MNKKEHFINKSNKLFNNSYVYDKVKYVNCHTKVCIICPEHGEFFKTPHAHLCGQGCPICSKQKRRKEYVYSTEDFIKQAHQIHGDKYDYSKVEYKGCNKKVCIICPEHGEFWQTPSNHLKGRGCNLCSKSVYDTFSFIEKAKRIHNNKYDYSKVEYVNSHTKVCIICPEHGEFWQIPSNHLHIKLKQGCPFCGKIQSQKDNIKRVSKSGETFIERARKIHGDKYDYSKVEYKNAYTKVCIICPEHGEFWQTPDKHINSKEDCPKCKESLLEREVRQFLEKNNISYIQEYNTKWLGKQRLDFYLPDYNIAIECQGIQHYKPIDFGGDNDETVKQSFLKILKNDFIKKRKLIEHNVKILYYTKSEFKKGNEITNINELLKYIN